MSRSLQLGLRTGDLFQTPSVPRSCSVQITKLHLNKGSSREEQHFSLAFQASSRRILARVDEVPISTAAPEDQFDNPVNVAFEYQHFTKNRSNHLYISLQKRKKYRARAVSGFKSIARGQINLDQVLQCPPNCPLKVNLYQNEKDSKEGTKQSEIGHILVSEIMTIPTEDSKYDSSDTEDDEHESRKLTKAGGSVASRVKSVRVLKKFIEKVLSQKQDHNDVDLENIDIDIRELDDIDIDNLHLYDELDGYGISDDDDEYFPYHEQDDNLSFASTPRPNIKPYFDTTSQCSFQPRLSTGGRSHNTIEQTALPSVDEEKKKDQQPISESVDPTESNSTAPDTNDDSTKNKKIKRSQKSFESGDETGLTAENCALLADLVEMNQSLIVFAIRNSKNFTMVERLLQLNEKNERVHFFDLFKENIAEAFHVIVKKIHQINLKQKLKEPIRVCLCGNGDSFNQMIQIYFDEMNKKSVEWYNYFSFIFVLSESSSKSDLSSRFSELCPIYKSTFIDSDWVNKDCNQLITDFELLLTDAIHNFSIPVGEALISFIDEQTDGNTQLFVPFCCEVSLSEVFNFDNSDSDCEDRHGSKTLSPTSSPFNQHSTIHNTSINTSNEKLQLCIDYWTEDKDTKQNTKETLKTIDFIPFKQHIKMDMNIRAKRGGLSRLPGRKLGSDEQNKFKTENIVRAICKSRNAIEKSKINKITIDGIDYHNISYFQISKLTASGHTKTFPIALFTPVT